ncbi:hypothetical protein V8C40DRAFT_17252 [Trichoderma camerunense]
MHMLTPDGTSAATASPFSPHLRVIYYFLVAAVSDRKQENLLHSAVSCLISFYFSWSVPGSLCWRLLSSLAPLFLSLYSFYNTPFIIRLTVKILVGFYIVTLPLHASR